MNFQPKLDIYESYHPLLNMIESNNEYIRFNYNDFSTHHLPYHVEKYEEIEDLLPNHGDYSDRVGEHLKMLLLEQCNYFSGRPHVIQRESYLLDKVTVYMYGEKGYGVGSYEDDRYEVYPPRICPFTGERMYE